MSHINFLAIPVGPIWPPPEGKDRKNINAVFQLPSAINQRKGFTGLIMQKHNKRKTGVAHPKASPSYVQLLVEVDAESNCS